jgi:hypothetical protein
MNQYDLSRKLGVSLFTVFTLLNAKKIKGEDGGKWFIHERDFEKFRRLNPKLTEAPVDWRRIPDWLDGVK